MNAMNQIGNEEIMSAVPCARSCSMRKTYINAGITNAPPVPAMPTKMPTTAPTSTCSDTLIFRWTFERIYLAHDGQHCNSAGQVADGVTPVAPPTYPQTNRASL